MNAVWILVITLVLYCVAYIVYGKFLSQRLFQLSDKNVTPAHRKRDGLDFEPAKNWLILFGHHFSSICGAGPIVGPVLALAYWGWAPSWIWILFGAVLFGAVADFSSLVVSVRADGQSISEIAKPEISPRARLVFSIFIWLSLILIIAVFAIFGAKTFVSAGETVLPSWGLLPVAVITGLLLYRSKTPTWAATLVGLGSLGLLLLAGQWMPMALPSIAGLSANQGWICLLLLYCLVASVTPVQLLLQPRDYLASFLLFATIGLAVVAIFVTHPTISTPPFHHWNSHDLWPGSGPLFPMLFVTIACGAISGFHSLVSSGTTCKQLAHETHACRIGYGGMLTEGLVGVLVLIAVAAGMSQIALGEILRSGGPIAAFGEGYGRLTAFALGDYGKAFAILALNTFILTTLDSATRITRYLTMDLFRVRNKYLATLIVIVAAGLLALTGHWGKIWPAFGTANQLIAGLSLLVTSCWLIRRGRPAWPTLIPAIAMLLITTSAFGYQCLQALRQQPTPDYFIAGVTIVLTILSLVVFVEALGTLRGKGTQETASAASTLGRVN